MLRLAKTVWNLVLKMIKFNVASINCCTEIEGPNKRLTIWFQGCTLHCKGCCNPTYQPLEPRNIISLENLLKIIKDSREKYGIEGVTYSGGEPTLQQNLPVLTKEIHKLGLGVISFTGRKYEEVSDALDGCDVVLDGPYIEEQKENTRKVLGSTNQRIIILSDRYPDCEEWFFNNASKEVEINVGDCIIANGDVVFD